MFYFKLPNFLLLLILNYCDRNRYLKEIFWQKHIIINASLRKYASLKLSDCINWESCWAYFVQPQTTVPHLPVKPYFMYPQVVKPRLPVELSLPLGRREGSTVCKSIYVIHMHTCKYLNKYIYFISDTLYTAYHKRYLISAGVDCPLASSAIRPCWNHLPVFARICWRFWHREHAQIGWKSSFF